MSQRGVLLLVVGSAILPLRGDVPVEVGCVFEEAAPEPEIQFVPGGLQLEPWSSDVFEARMAKLLHDVPGEELVVFAGRLASEPAGLATDRALYIAELALDRGWPADRIRIRPDEGSDVLVEDGASGDPPPHDHGIAGDESEGPPPWELRALLLTSEVDVCLEGLVPETLRAAKALVSATGRLTFARVDDWHGTAEFLRPGDSVSGGRIIEVSETEVVIQSSAGDGARRRIPLGDPDRAIP